jgi:peptide/nickel transport system permease protein
MLPFVLRRLAQLALTLALLALVSFLLVRAAPGGPAAVLIGPDRLTPEREAELNRALGLDRPLLEQFRLWVSALVVGDLGYSYFHNQPAFQVVGDRLPATLLLGGLSWLLAVVGGVLLGAGAAVHNGGRLDRLLSSGAVVLLATPSFWLGIGLIFVFSAWLRWLPSAGVGPVDTPVSLADRIRYLLLPLATLTAAHLASLALYARAAIVDTLGRDYVRTARAKGLRSSRVLFWHIVRNAAIPIATIAGLQLAHLVEGAVVVETVFAWPGVGSLTLQSIARRDYPVLMAITLLVGVVVILANLVTDLVYRRLDPRLDYA